MQPKVLLFWSAAIFFIICIALVLSVFEDYAYCAYTDCHPRYYRAQRPLVDRPSSNDNLIEVIRDGEWEAARQIDRLLQRRITS
ncbi:hypothetical protein CAEBREN_20333 [Caenorhabditis brenneri]|uniref:Uncharacterized protein n=1 Tax=Caenorhabditis brenneri TaxID=135651 RepID=G0M826_CAEBE|nr:hypothetical protein CAEBREN_20333 [Caenorhabditis brenneri]